MIFQNEVRNLYGNLDGDLKFELLLSSIQDYKHYLTGENVENKWEILKKSFPHYIWIIRMSIMDRKIWEDILDATSTSARLIKGVLYRL